MVVMEHNGDGTWWWWQSLVGDGGQRAGQSLKVVVTEHDG